MENSITIRPRLQSPASPPPSTHPSHLALLPVLLLPRHSVNKLRDVLPSGLNALSAQIQINPALEAAVTNNSIMFIILTYPIYESGQA